MAASDELGQLNTLDWRKLQELADTYHEARRRGASVDFEPFLPPPNSPIRRLVLHELIIVDLEMRWQQRQGTRLEEYLERFPELGSAPELPAKLIQEEYRVRHTHGDHPPLLSYRNRFPVQFDELRRLVDSGAAPPTPSNSARPTVLVPPSEGGDGVVPVVGGYKVIERIGSGSFGEVWRGEAPGGFPVAVKIVFGPVDQEEGQREKAALDMIRGLRHRCLIQTHSYWSSADRLVIIMELADGSLRGREEACRQSGLAGIPHAELLTYFRDAAEALDYLHARHVQHRDVKPENILLVEEHAKLADFGLSRLQEGSRRMCTATGVGTPLYMAPEVFRGKVSSHSDQYSLALTYGELRLARRLLTGTNLMDIMLETLEKTPDLSPLPPAEQAALLKALAKEPEQRYPNCLAFVEALERAREGRQPAPPVPPPPPPPPQEPAAQAAPTIKPTGRPTDVGQLRATGRISVGRITARGPQLPSWRAPAKPSPSGAAWLMMVMLLLALGLLGLLVYLAFRSGPSRQPPPSQGVAADGLQLKQPPPLQVVAGTHQQLTLQVHRGGFREPLAFSVSGLPPQVTIPNSTLASGAESISLDVAADRDVQPAIFTVMIAAEGGDQHQQVPLQLTVLVLPPECRAIDAQHVERDNALRPYYARITRQLADGTPVPFALIPRARKTDPETFYMMVDKVSVGLFRQYLKETGVATPSHWNGVEPDARADWPALGIGGRYAYRFAEWMGGKLPTTDEWDKAAGRFDPRGRQGPFEGTWDDARPLEIAVRRGDAGPLAVGAAKADVTVFGCHDMAGNGWELTGSLEGTNRRLAPSDLEPKPPGKERLILWRGQGFREAQPLFFRDLEALGPSTVRHGQEPGESDPQVGFRVVLELN